MANVVWAMEIWTRRATRAADKGECLDTVSTFLCTWKDSSEYQYTSKHQPCQAASQGLTLVLTLARTAYPKPCWAAALVVGS